MAKLEGLEFLRKNIIEEKKCNLKSNFAFISYAHDEADVKIVRNVFHKLYEKGYNLWIDTANIPMDENSWKTAAQEALMNEYDTCKVALFFRSEESMVREPIFEELEMIKELPHINRIIVIDIWHDDAMTAEEFRKKLIREKKREKLNICSKICTKVSVDSSVFRMRDVNSNLDELVSGIAKEIEKDGVLLKQLLPDLPSDLPTDPSPVPPSGSEYVYTIFGKEYKAGKLSDMMHDVFKLIAAKYPTVVPQMAASDKITAVALKSDVDEQKLPSNKLNYFKAKKEHMVEGVRYYVSTHYNRKDGITQLKRMLELCEGTAEAFQVIAMPEKTVHNTNHKKGLGELL